MSGASSSPWHQRAPWTGVSALYVADFTPWGTVKIGKGRSVRARLRVHAQAGAETLCAFPFTRVGLDDAERRALADAARFGLRVGSTEEFAGLPFASACAIVGKVTGSIGHDVPLADVIGYDHPRAQIQPGINRSNGWRTHAAAWVDVT